MMQLTWGRSSPRPPESDQNGHPPPVTRAGARAIARAGTRAIGRCARCGDVVPTAVGHSLLHRLGCLGTWFRSDEGPPLTPEEEAERWRLLSGCGF